jgi:hypothetical protein
MKARPVRKVAGSAGNAKSPVSETSAPVLSQEDEQKVIDSLRELGYIE